MCIGLYVTYPLYLSDFNETWIIFSKNTQVSNVMKMRPVGAELLYADKPKKDGQTDRNDEVNSRFSQFCEQT
jgi:hypothetical protein